MPQPSVVATLATNVAKDDLALFLFTLGLWNSPPKVYLLCDQAIADAVPSFHYSGIIVTRVDLDQYSSVSRSVLERTPGKRLPTRWADFMAEKINLMNWAFSDPEAVAGAGVLFCDADICFLGPLPAIPEGALAALSPHYIRPSDEARFGKYNGGFVWLSGPAMTAAWLEACPTARFYEQSALEDVAVAAVAAQGQGSLYEFPRVNNYGWWRMFQGIKSPADLQAEWSMNRNKAAGGSGILVNGEPLGSIHTHFGETRDAVTNAFNGWVLGWLRRLGSGHAPARRLLAYIERNFSNHRKI
jgi:hypothetical protein